MLYYHYVFISHVIRNRNLVGANGKYILGPWEVILVGAAAMNQRIHVITFDFKQ